MSALGGPHIQPSAPNLPLSVEDCGCPRRAQDRAGEHKSTDFHFMRKPSEEAGVLRLCGVAGLVSPFKGGHLVLFFKFERAEEYCLPDGRPKGCKLRPESASSRRNQPAGAGKLI